MISTAEAALGARWFLLLAPAAVLVGALLAEQAPVGLTTPFRPAPPPSSAALVPLAPSSTVPIATTATRRTSTPQEATVTPTPRRSTTLPEPPAPSTAPSPLPEPIVPSGSAQEPSTGPAPSPEPGDESSEPQEPSDAPSGDDLDEGLRGAAPGPA